MLALVIILLIILWVLGFIQLPALNTVLFSINGHDITIYNILILALIAWVIGILPSPFRQIAAVVLVLWVLSILGFIAIAGLSNILVIGLIVGLIFYLLGGF